MCGICGIVSEDFQESVLQRMVDSIAHRGPDDHGIYTDRGLGLGFVRLSIVDLAGGHQPMTNEDESIWLIFNGEIYNHKELRENLIKKGHVYKTNSDTETILHLYEEEGLDCFSKLNGMFAVAIWDTKRRKLVIARDRLGIKPLYYYYNGSTLLFSSEIKGILAHPSIQARENPEKIREYLSFRNVSGEETIFNNIRSLLPGHILTLENSDFRIQKYWELEITNEYSDSKVDDFFEECVDLQLMADVPVGVLLSGGLDSSLVTAVASKLSPNISSFSVGFKEKEYDELGYSRIVSDYCKTRKNELILDETLFTDNLENIIYHLDEPLAHANSVPIFLISKLAKESVKVLLTGEGADEVFCGYPRYLIPRLLSSLPSAIRPLGGVFATLAKLSGDHRLQKLAKNVSRSEAERLVYNSEFLDSSVIDKIVSMDLPKADLSYRFGILEEEKLKGMSVLNKLSYLELKTYLIALLNRVDKTTMAAGIEARVPFLDHRFVEYGFNLSEDNKVKGKERKYILKDLAYRLLPSNVIERPKSGFGLPIGKWLLNDKGLGRYLDLLTDKSFKESGYFNSVEVSRMVDEHRTLKQNHEDSLWEVVSFEIWRRIFIEKSLNR
jgi:asparagine synthase (glutamine-hydrolysing)